MTAVLSLHTLLAPPVDTSDLAMIGETMDNELNHSPMSMLASPFTGGSSPSTNGITTNSDVDTLSSDEFNNNNSQYHHHQQQQQQQLITTNHRPSSRQRIHNNHRYGTPTSHFRISYTISPTLYIFLQFFFTRCHYHISPLKTGKRAKKQWKLSQSKFKPSNRALPDLDAK